MEAISEFGPVDTSRRRPFRDLQSGYSYIEDGDIALAKVTPCFENGKGFVAQNLPCGYAFATTEVSVIRPKSSIDARYLSWIFQSSDFLQRGESHMTGSGGLRRVPDSFIEKYSVPLPRITTQQAIADYLDHETARIDDLVKHQQELINTLLERRQAVVSHMTASDQFSRPSDWDSVTLRRIGRFVTGKTPTGDPGELYDDAGPLGWARPEDLGGYVVPSRRLTALAASQVRQTTSSVLICCIGATVGKVGWSDGPISSNQQITAVEIDGIAKYWYYSLTGLRSDLVALAVGNTIPILNNTRLAELRVSVPPVEQQQTIVSRLDTETERLDKLIHEAEKFIQMCSERRTALISAAVTGQIDLRETA
ncbi:restriction endonuclease subunit S [Pseudonocardia sp. McavD-2-B]|uniref:restriction endonuclease subunit S n=1 Tax=Pseudonocardia sp. McavD-2-B TaxID=2954499 RepID=UPI002097B793|nr:restriction endonuclease subunit S [Pseudonocardia sp. McavD-2-B]MCO7192022.1 restriction endonuclease subunit S [Pseudonocardia sp. McavD-2-B]